MFRKLLIILFCVYVAKSSKILCYFPGPSISSQVYFQPIWQELSLRGHEVTVITPNPLNDPSLKNLTEIDVSFIYHEYRAYQKNYIIGNSVYNTVTGYHYILRVMENKILKSQDVQELINNKDNTFDLIIFQWFSNVGFAFGAKFKAPVIGISALNGFLQIHETVGNPTHPALYSENFMRLGEEMTFFERLQNTAFIIWFKFYYFYYLTPKNNKIAQKYFGKHIPYVGELEKNVSLVFYNSNPVMDYVKATVPAAIGLSQIHIKPRKPLPKNIKDYLDGSSRDVIYFSLGSNMNSTSTDDSFVRTIKSAIRELPFNFIWKWEDDFMMDKPNNVFIQTWLPQQDVLGHPKVKGFIMQCGLQSLEETITNGVPVVCFPFLSDQEYNVKRINKIEIGISLDPKSFTKKQFKNAVHEIVNNKKYKNNVQKYGRLLQDQPMKGLEKAIWWIEFTIRHKGNFNFKSNARNLPWYQYFYLDIILFVVLVFKIFNWLFKFVLKQCRFTVKIKKQ